MKGKRVFRISEIFESIQFEGVLCGTPALFVRFQGCNLQCPWCDTEYARAERGYPISGEGLAKIITESDPLRVTVFTGGEPTLQPIVEELFPVLHPPSEKLYAFETNGTKPAYVRAIRDAHASAFITFSPKPLKKWEETYAPMWELASEIKIVYDSVPDAIIARAEEEQQKRQITIFMQPMTYEDGIDWETAVRFVQEHPTWRLSTQTHKLLGLK